MSIIEELYYGNICPCELSNVRTEEYKNALKKCVEYEKRLLETLSNEQRELYDKMMENRVAFETAEGIEKFKSGFKLGAKFMLESLDSEGE